MHTGATMKKGSLVVDFIALLWLDVVGDISLLRKELMNTALPSQS